MNRNLWNNFAKTAKNNWPSEEKGEDVRGEVIYKIKGNFFFVVGRNEVPHHLIFPN